MSLIALCIRRSILLRMAAATDKADLHWQTAQTNPILFQERIAIEQPRFALITNENLNDPALFTNVRTASPQTIIVVCLILETSMSKSLWAVLDSLEFDVVCTLEELTDCLLSLKAGRFYQSYLIQPNSVSATNSVLPGWYDLTPAERRVLKLIADHKTGPQIADILCICEKTANNHKARISQKLNVTGGPGSLTRFVTINQEVIRKLLD